MTVRNALIDAVTGTAAALSTIWLPQLLSRVAVGVAVLGLVAAGLAWSVRRFDLLPAEDDEPPYVEEFGEARP